MAEKFGPIMYMRMGANPLVIASTADAAQEFLKVQDKSWASRPQSSTSGKVFSYNFRNIVIAPYGPHWRHMRKICMLELFTQKRMDSFRTPRGEEFDLMVKSIYEDSVEGKNVPMTVKLSHLASNNITRMLLGKRFFGTDEAGQLEAHRFKNLVFELFTISSVMTVGDFFPWLKWTSYLTGYIRHLHQVKNDMDAFLQEFLDVKKNGTPADASRGEDLVDVLLSQPSESGDGRLDDDAIKGVIQDMLLAGTDTSSNTVEWAIAALLQNPHVLRKLQAELDSVVGTSRMVLETDLPSLPYLQAVVKETFRLYPPAPMNLPHESLEPTSVRGYEFPAKTALFVNLYAIHRDPNVWERPLEFDPERFISQPEIDMRGNHFGLIPFGAGRRQCPGMPLGILFVQMGVARLVQAFNFGLPDGMRAEDLDMSELFGVTMPRKVPLVVVAKPRLPAHLY